MFAIRRSVLVLVLLGLGATPAWSALDLSAPLPLSPRVTTGTLPNGLTYYIRKNTEPENRIDMRLVVNAGSIQEDDDQRGLAHFVEHMAFNGTRHFNAQELVDYLETIGMRFGADVNAFTRFDNTTYELTVPADSAGYIDKAFLILEDWAHGQTFPPEEVEKERGVVIEEWRTGRGADQRMREAHQKVLFAGSRYAERNPIGTKKSLDTFTRDQVVRFYHDWYRPDLMAVIVVGDIDTGEIKARIEKQFGGIPAAKHPRERADYTVPTASGTVVSIATDAEAGGSSVSLVTKLPRESIRTLGDYRRTLVRGLFSSMLNARFQEIVQKGTPPFIAAYAGPFHPVRGVNGYALGARTRDDDIAGGTRALVVEAERASRFGFQKTELDRATRKYLRSLERQYTERDQTDSGVYARTYAAHFLEHVPVPGIEFTLEATKKLLPTITLKEIDALADTLFGADGHVVMVSAVDKKGVAVPKRDDVRAILAGVDGMEIEPYKDTVTGEGLLSSIPAPGEIVDETHNDAVDVDIWRLSNGVRVLVKKTDFKNDEIIFGAWSPGGTSLASDATFASARLAGTLIGNCGLGDYSPTDLQKLLAGKQFRVTPQISELAEGLAGSSTREDLETMTQVVYLFFTAPRHDRDAFDAMMSRITAYVQNLRNNPNAVYNDSLTVIFSNHHPRSQPFTTDALKAIDFDDAYSFFADRFADAGDFTMAFVGSIDEDALRRYVKTYIASLPTKGRKESWRDVGRHAPDGVVVRSFHRGVDEKSRTTLRFSGGFDWSRKNRYAIRFLAEALRIRLREVIREEESGTYGVSVNANFTQHPRSESSVTISFGADPARLEELVGDVFGVIEDIQAHGVSDEIVEKIVATQRREFEERSKQNGYWVGSLQYCDMNGIDFHYIVDKEDMWKGCSSKMIRDAARRYLKRDHYARVSMLPEEGKEKAEE